MRQLLVFAAVLAACGNKPAPSESAGSGSAPGSAAPSATPSAPGSATPSAGSGSAGSAADPWATKPKVPDTPEARQKRAEAALARVADIEPRVAKLRGLAFDREVPTRYQRTDEFQAFVRREIARELPPAKSRDLSAALAHLGFLDKLVDIATVEEQAMVTQAGAYYDPEARAFFLVMVPDSELLLDTISAHELTHALQDQRFDLKRFLPSDHSLDDDAISARRFIVEGDATFVMLLYSVRAMLGDKLTPAMIAAIRAQLVQLADLDIDALKAQAKGQSAMFGALDGDVKKSIDAMDDIPPIVLVPLLDAYMKGAMVALTAYEQGGWPRVDELYRKPPSSTEQVLHPRTKLIGRRDEPRRVVLARPSEPELVGNVFGELQWRVYFQLWKIDEASAAAEGWGGDRYSVIRRKDGRLVGTIATTWDTPADAAEFAAAYVASLGKRFPGADLARPDAGIARPDAGKVFVRTTGKRVLIIDGADEPGELDAALRTIKFE